MSTHPVSHDLAGLPRRALMPILIPVAVLICTAALIAWNAWPVLRSIRTVEVSQAVFIPSTIHSTDESGPQTEPTLRGGSRTVQAAGWLESDPYLIAASALADGVINEMLVLDGDRVEQGQPIATMVHDDALLRVERSRAELARTEAALLESMAQLKAAQTLWENPYTLQSDVESKAALLREREAELNQLPALIQVERARLNQVNAELASVERAYQGNAAAEIEYITAQEIAKAQEARLLGIQARDDILRAMIDRLESELHAAKVSYELRIDDRYSLDRAKALVAEREAEVRIKQAMVREAELELDRMTIRSPITGYVQRRLRAPGDKIVRMMDSLHSNHIAHLYDPTKIQVRVDVPLADAAQVYVGQQCEVVVEVLPDRTFQGEVLIVTHEADVQKNTLQVKIRVKNPDSLLRPEMLTRVKFLPRTGTPGSSSTDQANEQPVVSILKTAIDMNRDEPRVWIVSNREGNRGMLRSAAITTMSNETNDDWIPVRGPIQPGSLIVTDPSGCNEGERVEIVEYERGVL